MEFLHTMVRINDIESSIDFYCNKLGLIEFSRKEYEKGRFTLIFLCAPDDLKQAEQNRKPLLELTYNWDDENYTGGRNFGHLAFSVQNIYETCQKLLDNNITINVALIYPTFHVLVMFRMYARAEDLVMTIQEYQHAHPNKHFP